MYEKFIYELDDRHNTPTQVGRVTMSFIRKANTPTVETDPLWSTHSLQDPGSSDSLSGIEDQLPHLQLGGDSEEQEA